MSTRHQPTTVTLTSSEWGNVMAALVTAAETWDTFVDDDRLEFQQQMGARDHAAQLRRLMRSINAQNNTALGIDPATGDALLDALDATTEEEWS